MMTVACLLMALLLLAVGFVSLSLLKEQNRKIRKLKHSLLEAHQKTHLQDQLHNEDQSLWEQTEERLRSYLELMDNLINTIPTPIYYKDGRGYYQGCNDVFAAQVLGLNREHIIGKLPQELADQIPPDLAALYLREEHSITEKTKFHTFEAPALCADGQRRDFLFSLAPMMDHKGRLNGNLAVLSDLTEKNRAAQDRMQKEKLEGVLETAGAACHEFNQPLQALTGYLELMNMKLNDHDARPYVDKITGEIDRMRDISDKLQNITRYETKPYPGNTKIIDINKASGRG